MNKVAVITGASQGIGKALAEYFAQKGYSIALLSRNIEKLNSVSDTLKNKYNVKVSVYPTDVSNKISVKESIAKIIKEHNQIDVLFNNAGICYQGTSDVGVEQFEELIQTNLLGAFYILHATIPQMKKQRSGYIFNLVSQAGVAAYADVGAYCASKFGLNGYSAALHKELAPFNIKVTALHPGWVDTDMAKNSGIPPAERIQTEDIIILVDALLRLNTFTHVGEVLIQSRSDI